MIKTTFVKPVWMSSLSCFSFHDSLQSRLQKNQKKRNKLKKKTRKKKRKKEIPPGYGIPWGVLNDTAPGCKMGVYADTVPT